jgi:hypothetical protein
VGLKGSWSGMGAIVAGLHRAGYDLHLSQYGDNTWRATFYVTAQAQGGGAAGGWAAPWRRSYRNWA